MSLNIEHPGTAVCAGCITDPATIAAVARPGAKAGDTIALSLPGIHCGGCISTVESVLGRLDDVRSARVNLTLKRAMVEVAPGVAPARLIAALAVAGYEAHELDSTALQATDRDRAGQALLMRLSVAGFAAMNVMLLSVAVWSGASDATRDLFHWISAAITLPAVAFAAQPFFRNAWTALSVRRLNMDVPISLAILLAVVTSLWETSLSGEHAYFDAALTLTFFLLAGRYLDHRTRAIARSAAQELTALEVPRAWRVDADGQEVEVPVAELQPGMLIRVRPGGRMPVDGEVVDGRSELDRSLLTGETAPVHAGPGVMVSAGEVNLTGPLVLRAIAVGADTSLHQMAELVAVAESGRSRYTSLADRAARLYAPGVHILSALTFVGWWVYSGDLRMALNIAAAVLIITCPCALGLAVPAVTTAASGRLFRRGLLIKHHTALERLAEVDTVVFDKTGTLTAGSPEPVDILAHSRRDLEIALSLAEASSHPLAVSLATRIRKGGLLPTEVSDVVEHPGYGISGTWRGQQVRLGRAAWLDVSAPTNGAEQKSSAATATWLKVGTDRPVAFHFVDSLRQGTEETIAALFSAGKQVVILSGDHTAAVENMARRLGVSRWVAGALPGDKAARIQAMQDAGAKVLMVGDGLNDTAALSVAHVSISPASALDAARVASDIVLLGAQLTPIPEAMTIATKATRRIRQNFRIATIYNIIAVPVAVIGLATPLVAALAMSLSSITVSLNAMRLR